MAGDAELIKLLDTVLELPPAERQRWIDSLPAQFAPLKPRLRDLMARAARIETSDFLQTMPKVEGGDEGGLQSGDRIGSYRLVRELGAGGMGSVWLAERDDGLIDRPVALKLPHGNWSRTRLAERMARERAILASLEHPRIARLYDAGLAEDGRPWLALEYVEGRPIDAYCREQQLGVAARVDLFLQVADAVAHAHRNLVIHRDLKPTNILVKPDGEVRLLDFGIARLLVDDDSARAAKLTEFAGPALTPHYASPEQIRGEPLTTSSDVYALGVLLYELLARTSPYKPVRDSRGALEDAILDADPPRPSDAASDATLRGDLDTIVLKALRKNPAERYASVDALADDLRRYREGRPVLAQPDRLGYRLGKFVRRHRLAVSASAVALGLLLVSAGIVFWQARVAIAERERTDEALQLLTSVFTDADPYGEAGKALTAVELLQQAQERIRASSHITTEQRLALLSVVGYTFNNFQDVNQAQTVMRAALADAQAELPADHPEMLHARTVLALAGRYSGDPAQNEAEVDALLADLRNSREARPDDLPSALESAMVLALGDGRDDDAERYAREAIEVTTRRFGAGTPPSLNAQWQLVNCLHRQRKTEEALDLASHVMPQTLAAYDHNDRNPHVIEAREMFGRVLARAGRTHEGIGMQSAALRGAREHFGATSVAVCYFGSNLAGQRLQVGQVREGLQDAGESLQACAVAPGQGSVPHATTEHIQGSLYLAARDPARGLRSLENAIAALRAGGAGGQARVASAEDERLLALAMLGRLPADGLSALQLPEFAALIAHYRGRHGEAVTLHSQALAELKPSPTADFTRARLLAQLGLSQLEAGDLAAARASLQEADALAARVQSGAHPLRAETWTGLARLHLARGDAAAALPLLERADQLWKEFDTGNAWAGESAYWLARAQAAAGRESEARAHFERAARLLAGSALPAHVQLLRRARQRA